MLNPECVDYSKGLDYPLQLKRDRIYDILLIRYKYDG